MNKLTTLLNIKYPLVQGGMVWVSGGKLAASVSNAGGLGLIGAGSMKPELLKLHIEKCRTLTDKPFGINIPLLYDKVGEQIEVALNHGVKIFFTSAGSPKKWTKTLQDHGATVFHVTSSPELALKCAEAGVNGIVAEGFEAGGHNGREEITSLVLIPQVVSILNNHFSHIPLVAAGGFATGQSLVAAEALGADGVQMGTRFLLSKESSAHEDFKKYLLQAKPGSTKLLMKETVPVRLYENQFSKDIEEIEKSYRGQELKEKLIEHLGTGRAREGMLNGDLIKGELEVGQIVSSIKNIPSVQEIVNQIMSEYELTKKKLASI